MNDRIHKRNSLLNRIIDGSVTIDSVTKFEDLLKAFPNDPGLHRIYGDLLKKKTRQTPPPTHMGQPPNFLLSQV